MKYVYVSQKIEQQLPELVSYQLWYILSDYGCFRDERQKGLRIVIRRQGERVVMMLAEEEAEFEQDIN